MLQYGKPVFFPESDFIASWIVVNSSSLDLLEENKFEIEMCGQNGISSLGSWKYSGRLKKIGYGNKCNFLHEYFCQNIKNLLDFRHQGKRGGHFLVYWRSIV